MRLHHALATTVALFALCSAGAVARDAGTSPPPAYYVSFPLLNGGTLAVVDPSNLEIRAIYSFPGIDDGSIRDLYPAPGKPELYAIANNGGYVDVFNTSYHRIATMIRMPKQVFALTVSPSGDRIYGYNPLVSGSDYVVEIAGHAVLTTFSLPASPSSIAVGDHATNLFVSFGGLNQIEVIDRKTHAVERTIDPGMCDFNGAYNPCRPGDLVSSTDGTYIAAAAWRTAIIYDATTGRQAARIPLGDGASFAAFDPFSDTAWFGIRSQGVTGIHLAPPFSSTHSPGIGYATAFQSAGTGAGVCFEGFTFCLGRFTVADGFVKVTELGPNFPETVVFSP